MLIRTAKSYSSPFSPFSLLRRLLLYINLIRSNAYITSRTTSTAKKYNLRRNEKEYSCSYVHTHCLPAHSIYLYQQQLPPRAYHTHTHSLSLPRLHQLLHLLFFNTHTHTHTHSFPPSIITHTHTLSLYHSRESKRHHRFIRSFLLLDFE